jgi:hypothetical protein
VLIGGVVFVAVVVLIVVNVGSTPGQSGNSTTTSSLAGADAQHGSTTTSVTSSPAAIGTQAAGSSGLAAVESGVLPWTLARPLSREVVVPGSGSGSVVVLGGLTSANASSASVVTIGVPAGTAAPAGSLTTGTHDAAGAVLGGRALVFGGGAATSFSTVEAIPLPAPGSATTASVTGQLPQPRSDDAAVTVGRTAYVIGGYDGSRADPQVLATTNGSTFRVVGSLPVPVRYPAVAAVGPAIYVFGGEQVGGTAVNAIQRIDTQSGAITVVGHLPVPLSGAAAVTLGGVVYVAGGLNGTADASTIYAFDARHAKALVAGQLIAPVANAAVATVGDTAWLIGGESGTTPTTVVQMLRPNTKFGVAGSAGAGSPYYGQKLLIADRGNNRLLVLDDTGAITWTYPNPPSMPPPPGPGGFYFPDDAFFIHHGTAIISNQEENETIVQIGYPSGKILWSYGHPSVTGSSPGYLHEPDDAYLLKNGNVTVADADNCRIIAISPSGSVLSQVGTTGSCVHNPPTSLGGPNGDTPLANGDVLISETHGSFISEYTQTGSLVWTTHLAIGYPSDPQQIGPDLYLCADYEHPGGIIEFNRAGQILYQYRAPSGVNELNQPSLVELLPSGVFMINDDYRNRMAAIDPTTQALVWNYGVPDASGTAAGHLNIPDGFDILNPDGSAPLHPQTG